MMARERMATPARQLEREDAEQRGHVLGGQQLPDCLGAASLDFADVGAIDPAQVSKLFLIHVSGNPGAFQCNAKAFHSAEFACLCQC